jgi:hypothetical protein
MPEEPLPQSETAPVKQTPEESPGPPVTVGCIVLGGPWFVQFQGKGDQPILLGPHPSRSAAIAEAEQLRQAILCNPPGPPMRRAAADKSGKAAGVPVGASGPQTNRRPT